MRVMIFKWPFNLSLFLKFDLIFRSFISQGLGCFSFLFFLTSTYIFFYYHSQMFLLSQTFILCCLIKHSKFWHAWFSYIGRLLPVAVVWFLGCLLCSLFSKCIYWLQRMFLPLVCFFSLGLQSHFLCHFVVLLS